MASVVSWLLVLEEYVGGDDTVDVAGTDDDADDDAALVDAFDVVAAPGEGIGAVLWDMVSGMIGVVFGIGSTYTVG